MSKTATLEDLRRESCKRMMLNDPTKIRVWNAYYESHPRLIHDLHQTLQEAKIVHGQRICTSRSHSHSFTVVNCHAKLDCMCVCV